MNALTEILIFPVNTFFDHVNTILTSLPETVFHPGAGSGFMLGAAVFGAFSEGVLADTRKWHGSIDSKFSNIDNLVSRVKEHQTEWNMPSALYAELTGNHSQLQMLVNKCRTNAASSEDRTLRNSLLKSTVKLCLLQVKIWACAQFSAGILTADDVHLLGFRLPGETGGRHERTEATDIVAKIKVKVINEDNIRVVIDQSSGENAAQVVRGWPAGVRYAQIVITASDGKTEVYNKLTTRLHTNICMPEGSHGKQFIIKASFLKHIDDKPRFGNEPTFSMPLTTSDLVSTINSQHHEEVEAQQNELERQRQELERMQAALNREK